MSREIKFRVWDSVKNEMISNDLICKLGLFGLAFIPSSDTKPMQYTGLKDKNGVEIYEGDILWLGDAASIVQIVWVEFKLRLKWVNPMGASDNIYAWKDDLEVIGNIYENPGLLEAINEQGND